MIRYVLCRAGLQIVFAVAPLSYATAPAIADEPAQTQPATTQSGETQSAPATPAPAEWPCVYRKVPVLSAATIWDGPEITDTTSWRKDETIRKLSQYLISRRIKEEDAEAAIKKFAAGLPADNTHDAKLTELFAAVLTRTNEDRKVVMSGIERFHKRQLERAKEIEKEGIDLPPENPDDSNAGVTDDSNGPAGEISKLDNKQEKYKWEVRTFQEKEANIPIACEIPQLIDERAGAIARAIRAEMKS